MSDILLREMSNADIDWMVTTGQRQSLADGAVLIAPGVNFNDGDDSFDSSASNRLDALYLVLEGKLAMSAPCSGEAFAELSRGDLIGASWLFDSSPVSVTSANGEALVLTIQGELLRQKLQTEVSFAAHFYRTIALITSERIRTQFEAASNPDLLRYQSGQMVKEALFVFGELKDSDIDWMMSIGQVKSVAAEDVLLNMGRPVDALYTVLDGQLAIATTDIPYDPLSACSHGLQEQCSAFTPVAYISKGSLPGVISFLDFKPLPVRVHATKESKVLAIPRQWVLIKLQEDLGFAARFYRVMATQTAQLLASVTAVECRSATTNIEDEGELDLEALQQASQGAQKFDWMLKRLSTAIG
ncbi:cyclic nucleotide-binding domain protein [Synechococcus sp. PCC 7335]|uniref:cyclic nucleotide-binding domain protein n=1 Tax=Synechococcus sp. (strain ATCC 29403 / PCC 7335) TaxID=91464 RepID=UPI00017EE783|nr:cyclic nucleotide-binding domain protein [Synechococcus sp. PCC 7335]EDX83802.1 cyclic nucleotide-binding domain protein [Synechococcus sp. PCC 7335]